MAKLATLLTSEISRVARKELRGEVAALKKTLAVHRAEIAALKRRAQALEHELRRVGKAVPKPAAAPALDLADDGRSPARRFSAKGLAAQRRRLGLSAHDCGRLVGASAQSVYNWEEGKVRPQARHLAAIAALKALGKKTAAAHLAALDSAG